MPSDLQKEITTLKAQVKELMEWKQRRSEQQFSFPLDTNSVKILNETLRSNLIDRINVTDIFWNPTLESPTKAGQMRFFDNRTTQNMRITTTEGVFTGTVDLTAV